MKLFVSLLGMILLAQTSLAGSIVDLKDWSGDKRFIDSIGKRGCVAETIATDSNGDEFTLQVVTFPNSNGIYSNPLIIAVKENMVNGSDFYEARAYSNKSNDFNMTLFQVGNNPMGQVASRYDSTEEMVGRLRADSTFTVEFMSKSKVIHDVTFSLRGSSHVIKTVLNQCK